MAKRETDKAERNELIVLTAGVAKNLATSLDESWKDRHPDTPLDIKMGGSLKLANEIRSGKPCDVYISADITLMEQLLEEGLIEEYQVWASNALVIAGEDITSENWMDRLLDPESNFGHTNPNLDPGGYRAAMALKMAEDIRPGFYDEIEKHPGYIGVNLIPKADEGKVKPQYEITYLTKAKDAGENYAHLPSEIDFSDPDFSDDYEAAYFDLEDGSRIYGSLIRHGIAIPKASAHPKKAADYVKQFMALDFEAKGFLPLGRDEDDWVD